MADNIILIGDSSVWPKFWVTGLRNWAKALHAIFSTTTLQSPIKIYAFLSYKIVADKFNWIQNWIVNRKLSAEIPISIPAFASCVKTNIQLAGIMPIYFEMYLPTETKCEKQHIIFCILSLHLCLLLPTNRIHSIILMRWSNQFE